MLGLARRQPQSSSAEIAGRVAAARATIENAERQIPALRAEDSGIESEIRSLLGQQIAESRTDLGPKIATLRSRRADIAADIERLGAEADYARAGIGEAERRRLMAQRRETRIEANTLRDQLVPLLDRAERALDELWHVAWQPLPDSSGRPLLRLGSEEMRLWGVEMALRDRIGGPDTGTLPCSNVQEGIPLGATVIDAAVEALLEGNRSKFDRALVRIQRARGLAQNANKQPLP